jgi:hypothetical protein
MPIRELLRGEPLVYTPDDVAIIVQAFEQILRVKRLNDRSDPIVRLVAELTIEVARGGERDPLRLTETVLSRMLL